MTSTPDKNRRAIRRRHAKRSARVLCYPNALGLGANVAVALHDVSESGARLTVKIPLSPGQEVEVGLTGLGHPRSVKALGVVAWCVPAADGAYLIGVRFERYLPYRDLLELGE